MKVPIVIVGQKVEGYPFVYHSDYEADYEMTNFLISNNHKNIAYIGTNAEDISGGINRKKGFIRCLQDKNLKFNKNITIEDLDNLDYNLVKEMLDFSNRYAADTTTKKGAIAAMCTIDEIK